MYSPSQQPLKVKASIFRLYNKKTKVSTHLFSVFECIEADMQIRDDHNVYQYSKSAESSSGEKVFYTECVCTLDASFIANPLKSYTIRSQTGLDKFKFINKRFAEIPDTDEGYLLSGIREKSGFGRLFPDVNMPTWIRAWVDDKSETLNYLEEDARLMKQFLDLSENFIGIDITKYPEYIGAIFLIWHHPLIRSIDVSGTSTPQKGLSLDISYRTLSRPKLIVNVCQAEQGDCIVADEVFEIPTPGFRQLIPLSTVPNLCLIKIYDTDRYLLFHYVCQGLIQEIGVNVQTPSRVVDGITYEKPDGEKIKLPPVQKWLSEKSKIGRKVAYNGDFFLNAEKVRSIEKDRVLGNFIFFDGQKEKKNQNKENAKKYVQGLLNKASKRCMVCDDFFDAQDFGEYLYHVKNENVDLRVLSSMGDMGAECAIRLAHIVDDYNKVLGKVCAYAKMLRGNRSVVHDRFIVCDDDIWAVGASFNELGARASVIYKIPHEAGLKIIGKLEEWWQDETISVDVHDIHGSKKKTTLKQLFKNLWHEIEKYYMQ